MPLDLLHVSTQVREMGELLVSRRVEEEQRIALAQQVLAEYADRWQELAQVAELARDRVAVPTEPLDQRAMVPPCPLAYTAIATDGSEIDPDRHGAGVNFYVVNIGSARIPYGQPEREAELRSVSTLGYTDEDLFIVDPSNPRRQVPVRERHLDARRTVEELRRLADLAETEAEQHGDLPIVALVDGTLLFSVLAERPQDFLRSHFYALYVEQLDRLRQADVVLAAYASRTRGIDLVSLFRALCGADPASCTIACSRQAFLFDPAEHDASNGSARPARCIFTGLTDSLLLARGMHDWERSALFRVRSNVHDPYYREHRVFYFLLETGQETARVEMPAWVAEDPAKLSLVHAVLADQCAKGLGYPAVLARADDRAVLTTSDRQVLDSLVRQELIRRGAASRPSAKLGRKQVRTV